jgi:uncharacterized membrane protein YcaP (DUF421 family)
VLVHNGQIEHDQLGRCGLTEPDLVARLRQQGFYDLDHVAYVLFETTGELTVVDSKKPARGELLQRGIRDANHAKNPIRRRQV